MQAEQELPGPCTHNNEIVDSVGKASDGNDDPSKDPDHSIVAENTTVDEPDHTLDSVEVITVGEANDTNGHPCQESDVTVNAENSNVDEPDIIHDSSSTIDKNAEQTESMVDDDVEHNDISQKELPVQWAHDSEEVNTVDKVTDVNGDPSKDSDHTIDAENMTVDEPDCMLDSVEVNKVSDANDVNGHPSQEIDVQTDAENSNLDEPDIFHGSSKTNDANAEQTESIVDDDVEQNDVSQNIIQGLQYKTVSDDVEMEKADETTDVNGHVNKDYDDRIDGETTIIDLGKGLSIQGGVEMNNATPWEGSSVILGEQNIVQDGGTFIQDLLTMVDFNNDKDQASNSEEVEWNDNGGGGSTDYSEVENDSSDSSVKLSTKHIKNQTRNSELLPLNMMMIEVKVASLTTVVSLKYLQSNHKVNLNYYISLDYYHLTVRSLLQLLPLISL